MPSKIDPTRFADGQPVSKAELRTALVSAKAELEHGGYFKAGAPGAIERRVGDKLGEWLSVKDFGAKGDGVTDDTAAIQATLTYAAQNRRSVLIPAGHYIITDTLWATPQGSAYLSARIYGQSSGFWNAASQTMIDATALRDRPAIVFYNCRASHIGDLLIQGGGLDIETTVPIADLTYDRSWVSAGFRDSRYSPHCAIAVDAGCGSTPSDGGYPNMIYNGQAVGSHDLVFERVGIRQFVVGVAIGINTIQNCDGVTFLQCSIYNTKVAISVSHSQARGINYYGGDICWCRTCSDGLEYGVQQGASVTFYGTQIGPAHELFAFQQGFSAVSQFGIRTESLHRLGIVGSSNIRYPTSLFGCDIHLLNGTFGRPPGVIYHGDNAFKMIGGSLNYDAPNHAAMALVASTVDLDNIQISVDDHRRLALRQFNNAFCRLTNCAVTDLTSHAELGRVGRWQSLPARLRGAEGESLVATNSAVYRVLMGSSTPYHSGGAISNFAQTDATISFDTTDPAAFVIGDTLFWRVKVLYPAGVRVSPLVPSLKVTAITGARVTCRKLFQGNLYEGNLDGYAFIVIQEWAPGVPLTGNLVTGSSVILNCANAAAVLEPGDFIKATNGLQIGTRVLSIAGTSINLNRPATATANGVPLSWGQLLPL